MAGCCTARTIRSSRCRRRSKPLGAFRSRRRPWPRSSAAPRRDCCCAMQVHELTFDVDAPREVVWAIFWSQRAGTIEYENVTIQILHPGDAAGEGLIRHATFPVPRYLLSRGVGRSWEWLTEVRPPESWRYDAIGKPLWSRAEGTTTLEDLGEGRTRVRFRATYRPFNP